MNKQNVLYAHNGILFDHKKEWSTDTRYDMDGLENMLSKPDTKGFTLYVCTYTNKQIYKDRKRESSGCEQLGGQESIAKVYRVSFWGNESFKIDCGDGGTKLKAVHLYPLNELILWYVNFILIKPLDESERGGWKSWLKTQHSKN